LLIPRPRLMIVIVFMAEIDRAMLKPQWVSLTLVLLRHYCKSFNVLYLSGELVAERFCKVRKNNWCDQILFSIL